MSRSTLTFNMGCLFRGDFTEPPSNQSTERNAASFQESPTALSELKGPLQNRFYTKPMCHIQTLRYNFLVSKSDADISQWFPLIFRVFIGRFGWNIYVIIIKIVWLYVGHALKSPLLMQSDPDLGGWSVWVIVLIPIMISSTFVWGKWRWHYSPNYLSTWLQNRDWG